MLGEQRDVPDPRLRMARIRVLTHFVLMGATSGVWLARIPAIKDQLALNDAALGAALFAIPVGSITMMVFAGALVDRFGSGRLMRIGVMAAGTLLIPPGWAPGLPALCAVLLLFGASLCVLNIAINAAAVHVERDYGRPIMASFHAAYSIGGGVGAAFGGICAGLGAPPGLTFVLAAVCVAGITGIARGPIGDPGAPAADEGTSRTHGPPSRLSRSTTLLGLLALCGSLAEGAIADWSGVYLQDSLGTSAGFAASGFAVFSVFIAAGRVVGDRMAARYGPVRLVRGSGLLAAAGLGLGLVSAHPAGALVGIAAAGAGLSCLVPQVITAAGNAQAARSGRNIAKVSALSSVGNLSGPVLIGAVATATGLPSALAIPVALAFAMAAFAGAVAPAGLSRS
ncbi:MFS transporter [Nonomuraea sp. MCN248]|uniref:MFS transporter n=1 Tax=Nonomuraea corallina TaxID=2989783 RepID=A0ABT4S3P5_9ACTN|nr:MFS transporter [Nonomuraea corallina]MDA0631804.1 MFS transporter [Nonomuraea corallina]